MTAFISEKIKIFTAYHKPMLTVESKGYVPIFVGNALKGEKTKDGFLHEKEVESFRKKTIVDDDGDDSQNISCKNRSLNEMTAIYWIWKNYKRIGNPEYIGFTHYRRFLQFNESLNRSQKQWLRGARVYCYPSLGGLDNYINIEHALKYFEEGYQCLMPAKYDARLQGSKAKSCKDRFYEIGKFDRNIYDKMEEYILELKPEYRFEVQALQNCPCHYTFNMFVMTREMFEEYCKFIFPILLKLDKFVEKIEDANLRRAPGYLAEFLTSIFVSAQIRIKHLSVKELDTLFIVNPNSLKEILWHDQILTERDLLKIKRYDIIVEKVRRICPRASLRERMLRFVSEKAGLIEQ